jgi:hypothetical protein
MDTAALGAGEATFRSATHLAGKVALSGGRFSGLGVGGLYVAFLVAFLQDGVLSHENNSGILTA